MVNNVESLESLLAEFDTLIESDYNPVTWKTYVEAKEAVEADLENAQVVPFREARDGLEPLPLEPRKVTELRALLSIQWDGVPVEKDDFREEAAYQDGLTLLTKIDSQQGTVLRSELDKVIGGLERTVLTRMTEGQDAPLYVYTREAPSGGFGLWSWIAIAGALVVGLVAGILIQWLKGGRKKKRGKREVGSAAAGTQRTAGRLSTEETEAEGAVTVKVEKLHEQGARSSQQDSFFVTDEESAAGGMLAVVADGMGGLADGDKVSQAAVAAVVESFYQEQGTAAEQLLIRLLDAANRSVNDLLGPAGLYKSGSTIVIGLLRDGLFHYVSVGDSRISLFRDGNLYQLNREHIYRNELYVRAVNGEGTPLDAESHPKAAGLTSFLGMGELKHVDIPAAPIVVRPGDRFILMSDGVYNALPEMEFVGCMGMAAGTVSDALRASIQAKNYSNQDNYTAVILEC